MNRISWHRYVSSLSSNGGRTGFRLVGATAPLLVLAVAIANETARYQGFDLPTPFLLIFALVVIAATAHGLRASLATASIAALYILFAYWTHHGPGALIGHPINTAIGIALVFLMAGALGRGRDANERDRLSLERQAGMLADARTDLEDTVQRRTAELRDTAERLARSQARFEALFEHATEAIVVADAGSGTIVDANANALSLFGFTRKDLPALRLGTLFPATQPDGRDSMEVGRELLDAALRGEHPAFRWWHRDLAGREFPCRVHLTRLPDDHRALVRGAVYDISDEYTEEQLREGQKKVLQDIVETKPLGDILDRISNLVESLLPGSVCSVLLLDAATGTVRHGGGTSLSRWFRDQIEGQPIGPHAGSCGTAMWRGQRVIVSDIENDPLWQDYRPVARREGLVACWSTPLIAGDGSMLGSFAIYYREVREPTEREMELMDRIRHIASIAIERDQAAEALRHSEAIFRATFEQAAVGIGHIDRNGCWLRLNSKLAQILDAAGGDLIGRSFLDSVHPDDLGHETRRLTGLLEAGNGAYHVEERFVRHSGDVVWVNLYMSPVRRSDGSLERLLCVIEDVSDAHYLSEELSYQARHDSLTGLINRYEFEHQLGELMIDVQVEEQEAAVCFLDLDQFKLVNDTTGHVAGDELLRQLGRELLHRIRAVDTLARLGGDEFGVILRGCTLVQATQIAEKLRESVDEFRFNWEAHSFRLGVSIGLVPLHGRVFANVTEVMRAADAVCYSAKDEGRNRVVVWRENDAALFRRHGEMEWIPRIDRALEEDRFMLEAQPIVAVGEKVSAAPHFELLLRLDDDGTKVLPGAFLPAAERYGMAPKIDRWVVDYTLEWLQRHGHATDGDTGFSINLSGMAISDAEFRDYLKCKLADNRDLARRLCFEITETAAIGNLTQAASLIETLRGLGCRFALDDFGSGLSSFAYLKNLPVDYLKIDGIFIRDIVDDPFDRAIVRSIVEVARVMGHRTIAEFVESEAAYAAVMDLGVDFGQGYWLGRPRPLDLLVQTPVDASRRQDL